MVSMLIVRMLVYRYIYIYTYVFNNCIYLYNYINMYVYYIFIISYVCTGISKCYTVCDMSCVWHYILPEESSANKGEKDESKTGLSILHPSIMIIADPCFALDSEHLKKHLCADGNPCASDVSSSCGDCRDSRERQKAQRIFHMHGSRKMTLRLTFPRSYWSSRSILPNRDDFRIAIRSTSLSNKMATKSITGSESRKARTAAPL